MTVYVVTKPWDSYSVGTSRVFARREDAEIYVKTYNENEDRRGILQVESCVVE